MQSSMSVYVDREGGKGFPLKEKIATKTEKTAKKSAVSVKITSMLQLFRLEAPQKFFFMHHPREGEEKMCL